MEISLIDEPGTTQPGLGHLAPSRRIRQANARNHIPAKSWEPLTQNTCSTWLPVIDSLAVYWYFIYYYFSFGGGGRGGEKITLNRNFFEKAEKRISVTRACARNHNPGQNVWDTLPFMPNSCNIPMQCWITLQQDLSLQTLVQTERGVVFPFMWNDWWSRHGILQECPTYVWPEV